MTIEELKAMETEATPGPWPPILKYTPAELPFGQAQMPWTTIPLEDYALCQRLRNLAPEILALVEAIEGVKRASPGGNIDDDFGEIEVALNAFNAKLASL